MSDLFKNYGSVMKRIPSCATIDDNLASEAVSLIVALHNQENASFTQDYLNVIYAYIVKTEEDYLQNGDAKRLCSLLDRIYDSKIDRKEVDSHVVDILIHFNPRVINHHQKASPLLHWLQSRNILFELTWRMIETLPLDLGNIRTFFVFDVFFRNKYAEIDGAFGEFAKNTKLDHADMMFNLLSKKSQWINKGLYGGSISVARHQIFDLIKEFPENFSTYMNEITDVDTKRYAEEHLEWDFSNNQHSERAKRFRKMMFEYDLHS